MHNPRLLPITPDTDLTALGREWRALEAVADASFFMSWSWIGPWLHTVLEQGARPWLFRADGADHQPAALALLCPWEHRQRRLFRTHALTLNEARQPPGLNMVIEHNGLLCRRGEEATAWRSLLAGLEHARPPWTELVLSGLGETHWRAAKGAAPGVYPVVDERFHTWCRPLAGITDLDSLLAGLSRNRRGQIRRSIRHYEAQAGPIHCRAAGDIDEAQAWFSQMGDLHTARWQRAGQPGAFANPRWVSFHRQLIDTAFPRGEVQLLRIGAGDATLGFIYSLLWRKQVLMLQSGFAPGADNHQRPGYIAHCLAMVHNAAQGMAVYDFLYGDAAYKQSLGERGEALTWGRLRRGSLANRLEDLGLRLYRRAKGTLPYARRSAD